jgi:hypothetical protein
LPPHGGRELDEESGHAGQEDEQRHPLRDRVAESSVRSKAAGAEGIPIDQDADDQRRAVGCAPGAAEDPNQVERPVDLDERKGRHDREGRREHRECDVSEDLPTAGPVDQGGVAEVFRDVLEAGQEEDDRHPVPLPELDEVDHLHRPGLVGLPFPLKTGQADVGKDRVHNADVGSSMRTQMTPVAIAETTTGRKMIAR